MRFKVAANRVLIMRILFVGDFRYNSGSSHTIHKYFQIGEKLGHHVFVSSQYGSLDNEIPKFLPVAADLLDFDRVVFVFESNQYLRHSQIEEINRAIPRRHRIIIDPDGRANPTVECGNDSNHSLPYDLETWHGLYDQISDVILQPVLGKPGESIHQFLYYGFDHLPTNSPENKKFDILYIGNNWYRWHDIEWLLSEITDIRPRLGHIAIKGKWWDGIPKAGLENATASIPSFLARHTVETYRSVPFDCVISGMSEAVMNLLLVRPMIAAQQLATPRMFETFSADTIPLLGPNLNYSHILYGVECSMLYLSRNPAEKIAEVLDSLVDYRRIVSQISEKLWESHNYEKRFKQLLEFLG